MELRRAKVSAVFAAGDSGCFSGAWSCRKRSYLQCMEIVIAKASVVPSDGGGEGYSGACIWR